MTKKLIYLASPYSADTRELEQERYECAVRACAELMKQGKYVFSPIVNSHPQVEYGTPTDFEGWKEFDLMMLDKCDELYVLMIEGALSSKGVLEELKYAGEQGMDITGIDYPIINEI